MKTIKAKGKLCFLFDEVSGTQPFPDQHHNFPGTKNDVERALKLDALGFSTKYVVRFDPPLNRPAGVVSQAYLPKFIGEHPGKVAETYACELVEPEKIGFYMPVVVGVEPG